MAARLRLECGRDGEELVVWQTSTSWGGYHSGGGEPDCGGHVVEIQMQVTGSAKKPGVYELESGQWPRSQRLPQVGDDQMTDTGVVDENLGNCLSVGDFHMLSACARRPLSYSDDGQSQSLG